MQERLFEQFRSIAEQQPHAPAFTFLGGRTEPYSYAELFERASGLAERLDSLALVRDAPFGILLKRQEDQVLHYLAALAARLVPAILTPPNPKLNRDYYAETMAGVMAKTRFSAVVSDVGLDLPAALLEPEGLRRTNDFAPTSHGEPLTAAFLQFSSGTTGIKRGMLVSDRAAVAQLSTYGQAIGLQNRDVIVSWLPLYHDMGFVACLNMPLAFGVHTVMIDPIAWVTRPASFLRAASEHRATLAWNPNFAYSFMAKRIADKDLAGVDLSAFRGLVNCSEPVTHSSESAFGTRFAAQGLSPEVFWGCYAMAETTFAVTHGTPRDDGALDRVGPAAAAQSDRPHVSVGRALPGVEIRVSSPDGDELPDRIVGELHVRAPFTVDGYYNDPEATKTSFEAGWYRTGDLGYRADEALYVVGRKKDLMIVGGVNVLPQDVEELVSGVEGVIPGRVTSFSDFDSNAETERIWILFESDVEERAARDRLVITVRQRVLAAFQVANFEVHVVAPGWLVKSSSGKIARNANRTKWLAGATAG